MSTLLRAYEIAARAHACQKRNGGEDYINHPIRVAFRCAEDWHYMDDAEQVIENMQVALLHDVIENTHITLEDIKEEGFCEYVIELLDALTRKDDQTYTEYISHITHGNSYAYAASFIKKADIKDNYETATESMKERYDKALKELNYQAGEDEDCGLNGYDRDYEKRIRDERYTEDYESDPELKDYVEGDC